LESVNCPKVVGYSGFGATYKTVEETLSATISRDMRPAIETVLDYLKTVDLPICVMRSMFKLALD
jgi:hypothetical protein